MTLGERIKEVRKAQLPKLNQTEFGQETGATRAMIASYETNAVVAPDAFLKLLCMKYNVSALWLKDGIGEMFLPPDTEEEMVDRVMAGENEFAKSIMKAFAKLDDKEWEALKVVVDALKKTGL